MYSLKGHLINLPQVINRISEQSPIKFLLAVTAFKNTPLRHYDALYGDETCEDCVQSYYIPGAREDLKKLVAPNRYKAKYPCWQTLRRSEYKCRTDPEFMMDSFINYKKKCLGDPCAWDTPRTDLLYYRPSDKLTRKYPRTWIKCVMQKRRVKLHCHWEPVKYVRRKRPRQIPTCVQKNPCALGAPELDLTPCPKPRGACPTTCMPFCKAAKKPPKCIDTKSPSKCRRRWTKYPSFSECLADPLPDAPPVECKCLNKPMMCEVWQYWRKRKA